MVRAVALCDHIVRPEDLPERVRESLKTEDDTGGARSETGSTTDESLLPLAELERRHIFRVLARTSGNKQAAARILGIDRTTLQRKLERYDLEKSAQNNLNF